MSKPEKGAVNLKILPAILILILIFGGLLFYYFRQNSKLSSDNLTSNGKPAATDDLSWKGEPAPLGILTEVGGEVDGETWNSIYLSGQFVKSFQKEVNFFGEKTQGFFATFIIGKNSQGQSITADFFLGRSTDLMSATEMNNNVIDVDPEPSVTSYNPLKITASELAARLESEKKQEPDAKYAFIIHDDISYSPPNCAQVPYCVFFREGSRLYQENNSQIKASLLQINSVKQTHLGEGFLSAIYLMKN